MLNQKIVKKYIRQIKRIYRGKRRDKKQFITELQDALLCFCEEHPDSSYSDLVQEFGKPSECKELLAFSGTENLHKRNRFFYWIVNAIVIIAISVLVFFTVRYAKEHDKYTHGNFIEIKGEFKHIDPYTGEELPQP